MKHFIATTSLAAGLGCAALAGPSAIYQNYGVVTQPPVVDALAFFNAGDFEIETVSAYNLTNLNSIFGNGYSVLPYMTKDTLYFTNTSSGLMLGEPGFEFGTTTSTARHSAGVFLNAGTVEGVDTIAPLYLFSVPGGTSWVPTPADSQPIASQVLVMATNIINTGDMAVGDCGVLRLVGNNVTNAYATLTAGAVDRTGLSVGLLTSQNLMTETGLQGQFDWSITGGLNFFIGSPGVDDVFWGVTNGVNLELDTFSPPLTPALGVGLRGVFGGNFGAGFTGYPLSLPLNNNAQWGVSVFSYYANSPTNIYYNIVFVNTNLAGTNLSAAVGFSSASFPQALIGVAPNDLNGIEAIVEFSEPVHDVVTGQTVTNAVYLLDDGAYLGAMNMADNASLPDGFGRPNAFELTTVTPDEWYFAFGGNYPYDPTLIYADGEYNSKLVPYVAAEYGAQIGRNPADLLGSFSSLVSANVLQFNPYLAEGLLDVNLHDPTNEPGRIEISAGNLDMTRALLRAEGMVILNVTNLTGGGAAGVDWGEINGTIGATNGALVISNLFPGTFQRLRGDIYAWSATWANLQTNNGPFANSNNPAAVTNNVHYHMLVVDQNLFGTFASTARNLKFTGKKSIVLQDDLSIINQAVFQTTNLTINSSVTFSQNAQDFTPATTPGLQNLFIGTNGVLDAFSTLDVGFNLNQGQGVPAGQKYTVNTITNFGQMIATAPLLELRIFENDGDITSDNGGSIVVEANTLGLGLALTNNTNSFYANGNVSFSANAIQARNSFISAGVPGSEAGSLTLYAPGQLTDFVSSTPVLDGTNVVNEINNYWVVYGGGFSMPVKPASGDLFGTEITTSVTGSQQAFHVWAGQDRGANNAGFVNNAVIGRLVLDRESAGSILRFSAAGAKNAMYLDYLELTNYAYSDYREGLVIDPNFTIYFADCNGDPAKLMEVYPQLKWVQSFAGPNSTQVVPYFGSSNVCLVNYALAHSLDVSFWNGIPNYYLYQDSWPYILNDPSNPTNTIPCSQAQQLSLLVATRQAGGGSGLVLNLMTVSVNGAGTISPALEASQMALGQTYHLTATPSNGWVFNGWTTAGLGSQVSTQSRLLSFAFVTNTVITANFIPNPFVPLQGVYNGLFFQSNGIDPGSAGAFTLTLAKSGTFSGRLLMGPSAYAFNSQFSAGGAAQVQAKYGAKSLALKLQLDTTGQNGRIYGNVNGGSWDAELSGDLAPVWTSRNPSPLAGHYTMALPWDTGTISKPGGDSYGVVTVNKLGVVTVAGALADGTAFSASAPVSSGGQWPFYAYAAAGKDTVLGWVSVGANGLTGTNAGWSKAAGFTNVLQLQGSAWQAPASRTAALSLTNPAVQLTGGDLPETLTEAVALRPYLSYAASNVTLSINPSAGSFSGSFVNPGTGRKVSMSGVVLQNQESARGFFLGTNESGAVLLQDP